MRQLLLAALFAANLPLLAWGPEGHSLIARIADQQLTPAARARVLEILGPGKTMASVASWADEVRRSRAETGPWHYIDIPIDKPHRDMARDCPKGDCVIVKIADFRQTLQDPAATADQRREALMFLIHFVGDMHQPLHCSDNNDKGGNGVRLKFNDRQTNLHSLWDSGMLSRLPAEDTLFTEYSQDSAKHAKKYSKGTVEDWAEQGHKTAQKLVYAKLPKGEAPVTIDATYEKLADPVIRLQIERGGARLASILNATLK